MEKFEKVFGRYIEKAREFMNTNEEAKKVTDMMFRNAVKQNFTQEQWEKAKSGFLANLVLKMILDHEDLKKECCEALCSDLFNINKGEIK